MTPQRDPIEEYMDCHPKPENDNGGPWLWIAALIIAVLMIFSCKYELIDPQAVHDFEDYHPVLQLKVQDGTHRGALVPNAKVLLYKNESDYNADIPVDSTWSDSTGIATFRNLEPLIYTYRCEKGCLSNFNNHSVIFRLDPYKYNRWFTYLYSSANLTITNRDTLPIRALIDELSFGETFFSSIPVGTSQTKRIYGGNHFASIMYNQDTTIEIKRLYFDIYCDHDTTLIVH
jgi:hypothetical protein